MAAYLIGILSGVSRVLNALFGGPPWVTFSAGSELLRLQGSAWGTARVAVLDFFNPGHCERAYEAHKAYSGTLL